jgi:hypothetical protein
MSDFDQNGWSGYVSKYYNLKEIITDLKSTIDQLNSNFENAKKLILELAKRLDENQLCERNQISRVIKNILHDKIKQGYVTGRWTEECLPAGYKRKYVESEVCSLSKRARKAIEIAIHNSGKALEKTPPKDLATNTPFRGSSLEEKRSGIERRCTNCSELEEALRKASKITTAEQLAKSEIKIIITKDKYEKIQSAMQNSDAFFYIVINSANQSLVRAEPYISEPIHY